MRPTARLRALLERPEVLLLPGVFDGLSARLAAKAGFDCLYMSGSSVAASLLGAPDVGLTTLTDMADQARRIARAADLPLVADADTGFGNVLNAMETVRAYEGAGVAGLHIEDQASPKKCGHFSGRDLVPVAEMVGKLRAALDARRDPDFVVIARTDARGVAGLDEAIARARAYAAAGADAIFVEAPTSRAEYAAIAAALPSIPLVADVTEGGKSPALSADEYYALGFKLVLFSASASRAAMKALQDVYAGIARDRSTAGMLDRLVAFEERNRILGLADIYAAERRYGGGADGG